MANTRDDYHVESNYQPTTNNVLVSVGNSMANYFRRRTEEQVENSKRKLLEERAQNG